MIFSWAFEKAFNTPRVVVFIFPGRLCVFTFMRICSNMQLSYRSTVFLVLHGNSCMVAVGHMNLLSFYYLLRYLCIAL